MAAADTWDTIGTNWDTEPRTWDDTLSFLLTLAGSSQLELNLTGSFIIKSWTPATAITASWGTEGTVAGSWVPETTITGAWASEATVSNSWVPEGALAGSWTEDDEL